MELRNAGSCASGLFQHNKSSQCYILTRFKGFVHEAWGLGHGNCFFPQIYMMVPQNNNVWQLLWYLYIDSTGEGSELYCYNTEGNRNSDLGQASCRMDMTQLEQQAYRGLLTLWGITLKVCEYVRVWYFKINCVIISDKLTN
jgi:hypothetical protein